MRLVFRPFVLLFVAYQSLAISQPDFVSHNETWVINYLRAVEAEYPHLAHLYSIGKSVQGRDLWVIAIGESPQQHVLLRPEVKYVGNIHGNEVVGRELLIHLIHYLVTSYNQNRTISRLLNTTRLHILIAMNPDGYAVAEVYGRGDCIGVRGRNNARHHDLNRNFPDFFKPNEVDIQPESRAIMRWLESYPFVLSGTLHGGVLLVNYPYDNVAEGQDPKYSRSPDDDVFVHLAKTYSYAHPQMHRGLPCPYYSESFIEGITNGANWYLVTGSLQDYNYIFGGCMELTLEVSCCKFPPDNELEYHWRSNKDALIKFLSQVHLGVRGIVLNRNHQPIANATVTVVGRLHGRNTTEHGEFWRILLPGTYNIHVSAPGYEVVKYTLHLTQKRGRKFKKSSHSNVKLSYSSIWPDHFQNTAILEVSLDESLNGNVSGLSEMSPNSVFIFPSLIVLGQYLNVFVSYVLRGW